MDPTLNKSNKRYYQAALKFCEWIDFQHKIATCTINSLQQRQQEITTLSSSYSPMSVN